VVVKRKAKDAHVIALAQRIAAQSTPRLGRAFRRWGRHLGLVGSHLRELNIYQLPDPRVRRHTPRLLGAQCDAVRGIWTLILEDLSGCALLNTVDDPAAWHSDAIETALRGIAEVHSVWYGRDAALRRQPWIGPVPSATRRAEMAGLWAAMAENAADAFSRALGPEAPTLQRRLVKDVGPRWRKLARMPRTLIHNDFTPRNVALRQGECGQRLCAYDWELATLGVPQHDLAEFLCFVLPRTVHRMEATHYVELHRAFLADAAHAAIDPQTWELGFRLSLHDLLVDRFALCAMIDRFRPQRYLARVLSTWRALYDLYPIAEGRTS